MSWFMVLEDFCWALYWFYWIPWYFWDLRLPSFDCMLAACYCWNDVFELVFYMFWSTWPEPDFTMCLLLWRPSELIMNWLLFRDSEPPLRLMRTSLSFEPCRRVLLLCWVSLLSVPLGVALRPRVGFGVWFWNYWLCDENLLEPLLFNCSIFVVEGLIMAYLTFIRLKFGSLPSLLAELLLLLRLSVPP